MRLRVDANDGHQPNRTRMVKISSAQRIAGSALIAIGIDVAMGANARSFIAGLFILFGLAVYLWEFI